MASQALELLTHHKQRTKAANKILLAPAPVPFESFATFAVKTDWLNAECSSDNLQAATLILVVEPTRLRANIPGVPGPHGNGNKERIPVY